MTRKHSTKSGKAVSAEKTVKDIRRATRKVRYFDWREWKLKKRQGNRRM